MKKYLFALLVVFFLTISVVAVNLVQNMVSWADPGDPSIVKHRVYYELSGTDVGYSSSFVEVNTPAYEYDLSQLPAVFNGVDVALKLSAIDGVGNESNLSAEKVIFLDNQPPAQPIWN